jgi:hypothetical protein
MSKYGPVLLTIGKISYQQRKLKVVPVVVDRGSFDGRGRGLGKLNVDMK